jgi:probable rRNA maturation factor
MKLLRVFNRQQTRKLNGRLLRSVALWVLREPLALSDYELAIHLVDPAEMTRINESFLGHEGSTDVITFNNAEPGETGLRGELFISVADAVEYARQFRTTWQDETARYVVHGFLHLLGYDDLAPDVRKIMKKRENELFEAAAARFDLDRLAL